MRPFQISTRLPQTSGPRRKDRARPAKSLCATSSPRKICRTAYTVARQRANRRTVVERVRLNRIGLQFEMREDPARARNVALLHRARISRAFAPERQDAQAD